MNVGVSSNVLSLCSGGGGLDLGLRLAVPGARTVCYVENEITACGVLAARMEDESLDAAPIWTDLLTFDGKPWRGVVDWVIGGYPCQPFSNAGKRLGAADPRHLWPHVARIVADVAPRFCFFENVGAHLRLGGHEVIRELQGMGYRTAATLLTASEVGAPHGRERLFILAVADAERSGGSAEPRVEHQAWAEVTAGAGSGGMADGDQQHAHGRGYAGQGWRAEFTNSGGSVGDSHLARLEGRQRPIFSRGDELPAWPPGPEDDWSNVIQRRPDLAPALSIAEEDALGISYGSFAAKKAQPKVRGVANGLAGRMELARSDQLHILGNGVVPQQAAYALGLLMTEVNP